MPLVGMYQATASVSDLAGNTAADTVSLQVTLGG
jgi:hypothetical protein